MKSQPDYKAIAYHGPYDPAVQGLYGAFSAEQAVEEALRMCREENGGACYVYAVGDAVVSGYTQKELADVIESYDPKNTGTTESAEFRAAFKRVADSVAYTDPGYSEPTIKPSKYCQRIDGSVFATWGSCVGTKAITKAEYDRLENKTTTIASLDTESGRAYCRRSDGTVFRPYGSCGKDSEITKAEYSRAKELKLVLNNTGVTEWLESIGLEKYEAKFQANDITMDILSELTDSDLKEIGIKSLGARKRMLKAAKGL